MNQKADSVQNQVESRFKEFQKTIGQDSFCDPEKLLQIAKELGDHDLPLAYRIIQRARNIAPDAEAIDKYFRFLRKEMKSRNARSLALRARVVGMINVGELQKKAVRVRRLAEEKFGLLPRKLRTPFVTLFLIPWCIFSFYQLFWASPRFESRAQLIIKQPDAGATLDPATALLSGFGVPTSENDAQLVLAYVHSMDMLSYLESQLALREHYSSSEVDYFSRLDKTSEIEIFLEYYKNHVSASVDSVSGIISIQTQAFSQVFAQSLNKLIVTRAEWFINSIGHQLAEEQLAFSKKEHALVETKLQKAKTKLLDFQQRYNLLDPTAEGVAVQQIAYGIESQISVKEAELRVLKSVMSESAPEVIAAETELSALKTQRDIERNRLSASESNVVEQDLSVGQVLSRFGELKVSMELALQAYTSSLVSLEKSRIEAYRKLQYLVTVELSTMPQDESYPKRVYNISLSAILGLMLFGVFRIVFFTMKELNS